MYLQLISIKLKVDVDELEEIAMTEGVQAMPTFAFFKNGEKLNQVNRVSADELICPLKHLDLSESDTGHYLNIFKFAGANPEQIESTIDMIEKGMKPLKKLSSEDEFETIIAGDKLVCVDFFATWCPPCMRIAPVLVEMAHEMKDTVEFVKVSSQDEYESYCMTHIYES